jgi:hypothetical protein
MPSERFVQGKHWEILIGLTCSKHPTPCVGSIILTYLHKTVNGIVAAGGVERDRALSLEAHETNRLCPCSLAFKRHFGIEFAEVIHGLVY